MDLSNEALLIHKFQQTKDPALFKSLVRLYQNRIYNVAYRMLGNVEEAEEVAQDTCIKIHQSIARYKQRSSFAAWVFKIAHNSCLDILRTKQRRKGMQVLSFSPQSTNDLENSSNYHSQVVLQVPDTSLNPAQELDLAEQGEMIAASLKQLPEIQRAVVVLHDIEGFSYQEIAQIVGASLGTVRSRLHYGRLKLRQLLQSYLSNSAMSAISR